MGESHSCRTGKRDGCCRRSRRLLAASSIATALVCERPQGEQNSEKHCFHRWRRAPANGSRERHAAAQPSKHNTQATDAAVADATQAVADTTIEEAPKKPEIKIVKTTSDAPVVENACDEKWTSAELAAKCCDTMVAAGKLRATPAFIREDREAKLVKIFEGAKLDDAKVLACKNA